MSYDVIMKQRQVRSIGLVSLLVVASMLISGVVRGQQGTGSWEPKEMPISGWCSPPEPFITKEQFRRYADAGFTVVMPPCAGESSLAQNRKILTLAHETGLKAIVADARMPLALSGFTGAKETLRKIVEDYRRSPALLGYFLMDEPGAGQFAGLAEVVAELRRLDPDHLVYINLFPNYATDDRRATPSQLGSENYDQYLDRFMKTVTPDVLSFDSYGFLQSGDRPGYLGNLAAIQRAAGESENPVPFWQVVLSVQHGGYRKLTENELRYEAMQALVYGAQGLVYFTYWLPNDSSFQWSNGIMNRDGTEGPLYTAVKTVNHEVRTFAKWLYGAQALRTYQTGNMPADGRPLDNGVPVAVTGSADLSLALFRDRSGYLYVLVTNRDYKAQAETSLTLDAGKHKIERLDVMTGKWLPVKQAPDQDGRTTLMVNMGPAGGYLIRWL